MTTLDPTFTGYIIGRLDTVHDAGEGLVLRITGPDDTHFYAMLYPAGATASGYAYGLTMYQTGRSIAVLLDHTEGMATITRLRFTRPRQATPLLLPKETRKPSTRKASTKDREGAIS